MKKSILIFIAFLFAFSNVNAQMIVNDPAATGKLVIAIKKAKEQIERIKDQTKFLSDAKDAVVKVNNNVRQVQSLKRMVETNTKILTRLNSELGGYLSSPSLSEQDVINANHNFNRLFSQAQSNIDFITNVLSDNYFKLSDYERLELIQKKEQESIVLNKETGRALSRLKTKIKYNKTLQAINKNAKDKKAERLRNGRGLTPEEVDKLWKNKNN